MEKEQNQSKQDMTPQRLFDIMRGVEELYVFYKTHPFMYWQVARQNGKTLTAMRFIRQYAAIIRAYKKADRKIARADRKAARKAAKQYKEKRKKLIKADSCGTKAHHVIFDELPTSVWQTVTCWHCASPIYRKAEARVHYVDGDPSRRVYVCAPCHLKLHEKNEEGKK